MREFNEQVFEWSLIKMEIGLGNYFERGNLSNPIFSLKEDEDSGWASAKWPIPHYDDDLDADWQNYNEGNSYED